MDSRRTPSIAEWYHEETKYSPQLMGLLPRFDPDQRPLPYKQCTPSTLSTWFLTCPFRDSRSGPDLINNRSIRRRCPSS